MKIKIFTGLLLLFIFASVSAQVLEPTPQEKLITERFEYIRQIKNYIGNLYWKDFAKNEFPGTIVYFTDSASYFINPKPEMEEKVSKFTLLDNEYNWTIWRMRMPLDSAKFVMETQFQFDPKTKKYINYKTPVLFCSSPELTKKEKVKIGTIQEWSIALMHEMYHQYQYSNEAILTYVLRLYQEKKMIDMDSMQSIYILNQPYRDTLKLENDLLKKAVNASSVAEEKKLFTEFLRLRNKRRLEYIKTKKFQVATPENFWEKLEGTCLMMERRLKGDFNKIPTSDYIQKNDPMFGSQFIFNENDPEESNFYTELNDKNFYVGTTGYNMVQLLDKNKVEYKDNFFNYASLPLDLQLKYFYKIK